MASYGVLDSGFVDKPIETILSEIEAEQKSTIDAGFDVSSVSPAGQINGIVASKIRELWELCEAVYAAFDPDRATGTSLTALAALTGTLRNAATKSTVQLTINIDAGVTVPAGSIASVTGVPTSRFVTLADVTNSGGGAADFAVDAEAETAGPVSGNAGTITVIDTPVTGWNTVTNVSDATVGADAETDEELRLRRETELRQTGSGALDAIRADLLALANVTSVTMFENTSDLTDSDGLPPHSFEAVVQNGAAQDIVDQIWESKPAGIATYGTSSGTATDDAGTDHTVYFTRPTSKTVYLDFFLTINSDPSLGSVYPTDGDTQVKDAIVAWAQANLDISDDVVLSQMYPTLLGIDGVVDVTSIEADFTASPTATANLAIAAREIADIQSANITVTTA